MIIQTLKKILPVNKNGYPKDFQEIITNLYRDNEVDEKVVKSIWHAYQFGEKAHGTQLRKSGQPYFTHCAKVGINLSKWKMDSSTIIAGLLHDTLEDTDITSDNIKSEFGKEILNLVEGVSKLSGINFHSRIEKQAENFMKMFLSVAKDIRVIIIKFADRLHNMSTLEHLSRIKQRRIAIETRDVYAPLAHRLGMNQLKTDLENMVLKVLHPNSYKVLRKKIKSTNKDRNRYIEKFSEPVIDSLKILSINANISGRAKHYYSIFGKMKKRNKDFEEIYDLFAIRIIVDKIEECYGALGAIHQLFTPIQERFKDYIATPKSNGYQSIHTTVFGQEGRVVEVQIRTKEMDEKAEVGVAAHWIYKNKNSQLQDPEMYKHMKWIKELIETLQEENNNPGEFINTLKVDLFKDEIFVFTPRGDVINLPLDASPIDFAFQVHTQVGLKCIGAKVNSKIVPINTSLKNGDTIEIITSKNQKPNYAWLKFVKTGKAKSHIKRWVNKDQTDQVIKLGKEILEKTLRRMKYITLIDKIKDKPEVMGYNNVDLIFSAIAKGQINIRQIIDKYDMSQPQEDEKKSALHSITQSFIERAKRISKGVKIDGISNTLIVFAKCCNPIPGDQILGYITRGRGVSIHRSSCSNIPILDEENRFINVEWDKKTNSSFIVRLRIEMEDRKQLAKDVTENISAMDMNIVSIEFKANEGIATCMLIIEARDTYQLDRLIKRINKIPNLINVERI